MKEGVRKLVSEWSEALHFPGEQYWKVPILTDPGSFFASLPGIFPHGGSLFFEGPEIGLTARSLYEEFPARYTRTVLCDTIHPTPEEFHVRFEADFAERLSHIILQQGLESAFYHFKGYSETELVFSFHSMGDDFECTLIVSTAVAEEAVRQFARDLGQTAELATFPHGRLAKLKEIDAALNPSWWRKVRNIFRSSQS